MRTLRLIAGAAGLASLAASAAAQQPAARVGPSLAVTPYAGYMVYGNLLEGPLGSRVTAASAPVFGAQLEIGLTPSIAVVGNVAHSSSDLQAGLPILGNRSVGDNSLWMYDAGLQLRATQGLGMLRGVIPFVQAGAGAMRYDVSVAGVSTRATNLAWNAGLGADVQLGRSVGLRLLARDYIGKFDVKEATSLDYAAKTSHNVSVSAGLKLGF